MYSETIAPVSRHSSAELFLVRLEARPDTDSDDASDFAGALANCWIDADDLRSAESAAIAWLRDEQWRPVRFDGWELVTRESYVRLAWNAPDRAHLLEMFDTARVQGRAGTFYGWGRDAPDAATPNI